MKGKADLLRRFHDLSIRHKLFFSYFLLVLLFLCIFLAVNTVLAARESEHQAERSARRVFEQTRAYLQYKTESIRNLLYVCATNEAVQELFDRRAGYYTADIGRWPIDSQSLEKLLYPTNINPDIDSYRFYMKYGLASVFANDRYVPLEKVRGSAWFRKLLSDTRRIVWFPDAGDPGPQEIHSRRPQRVRQPGGQ